MGAIFARSRAVRPTDASEVSLSPSSLTTARPSTNPSHFCTMTVDPAPLPYIIKAHDCQPSPGPGLTPITSAPFFFALPVKESRNLCSMMVR